MHRITTDTVLTGLLSLVMTLVITLAMTMNGAALASSGSPGVPSDVPIAGFMEVVDVAGTDDKMIVTVHAAQKSVKEVAAWFQSQLTDQGWQLDGELVTATRAILPFKKGDRRCGITVTDFILNASMQMDRSTKGVSLQISGPGPRQDKAAESAVESTIEAAGESGRQGQRKN